MKLKSKDLKEIELFDSIKLRVKMARYIVLYPKLEKIHTTTNLRRIKDVIERIIKKR